uniref:Pyrin domain-containing protein n=1 Tax=Hucho hucho TaxID=62062 RepID=A0A4W5KZP6_9TELE
MEILDENLLQSAQDLRLWAKVHPRTEQLCQADSKDNVGVVHFLLLNTLKKLGRSDLKTFQWYLIQGVGGFPSISKCQLEKATRPTTVDRMVESYCDEGAVKITLVILRKMDQNNLADELKEKFPNNV